MKDKGILTIKGLAIIGVVFHHIGNRRFPTEVREAIAVLPAAFSWSVLAFFAASGWLHSLSDERRQKSIVAFLKSRSQRLLLPFFVLVILYAAIWQLLQDIDVPGMRTDIPRTFLEKVRLSLLFSPDYQVGEQLYFFPLLFLVGLLAHLVWRWIGRCGVLALCTASLVLGITAFPGSAISGFSLGAGTWAIFVYTSGFVMYRCRNSRWFLPLTLGLILFVILAIGPPGVANTVPILLLAIMRPMRLAAAPLLPQIGEASATIYAYHSPFLIKPWIIVAAMLPSCTLQFTGALGASAIVIAFCTLLFYRARYSPLGFAIL